MILLVALHLLVLHTVDGREIDINPQQVTTLREAHEADDPNRAFIGKVRCMINTSDGKFVTVVEECDAIRAMLEDR